MCCREAGEKETEGARGIVHRALFIFRLLLFLLGYPASVSAEETVAGGQVWVNSFALPLLRKRFCAASEQRTRNDSSSNGNACYAGYAPPP